MKKIRIIELFKLIKSTFVSFISIMMFVALSVGVFVGISWTAGVISDGLNQMTQESKFHDVEVVFSYGFDAEDIEEISEIEGVDDALGTYTAYEFFTLNEEKHQAAVLQISNRIEKPLEYQGELPVGNKELAIDDHFASNANIQIGDKIIFEDDDASASYYLAKLLKVDMNKDDFSSINLDDEKPSYLTNKEFTVTALIKSPRYSSYDGQTYGLSPLNQKTIDCFVYVNKEAFNKDAYAGYTNVLIRNDELNEYNVLSEKYEEKLKDLADRITDKVQELAKRKNDRIIAKISEIETLAADSISEAEIEINDASKQIYNGRITLNNASGLLSEGKSQLENGLSEVSVAEAELKKAKEQLAQVKEVYKTVKEKIEEYVDDYDNLILYLQEQGIFTRIEDIAYRLGGEQLRDEASLKIQEFIDAPDLYVSELTGMIEGYINNYEQKIADGERQISEAKAKINQGWKTYESKLGEYYVGNSSLNSAQNMVNDAKNDLDKAKNILAEFKDKTAEFKVIDANNISRLQSPGIIVSKTLKGMYDKLRFTMASLFVVVGLLVCYSAISRIVNDQVKIIGTKKALGFSTKEVTIQYLAYTCICIFVGIILGFIIGYCIIEPIFIDVLANNFAYEFNRYFGLKDFLGICFVEGSLLLVTTYVSCRNVLRKRAIELLAGQQPPKAKEKFFERSKLWKKMSLLNKTIVNNFFNDKRRVIGTLIGIAGSTALIVTALTFKDNFLDSFKYQYEHVFNFNTIVNFEGGASSEVESVINKYTDIYAPVYRTRMYINGPDGEFFPTHFYVFKDKESIKKIVNLDPFVESENETYTGLWSGASLYNYYHLSSDYEINFIDSSGNRYLCTANGYFKHHLANHFSFIDEETYKNNFTSECETNSYMLKINDEDFLSLKQELKNLASFSSIENFYLSSKEAFDLFEQLAIIMVAVYLSLSIVMSLLVLMNLLAMFIDEKKKELIVLMINGFTRKEAKRYIYSDTIVLTVIGIIFGLVIGTLVGNASIGAFDTAATLLIKKIDVKACLIGCLGSGLLTFVVSYLTLRKIDTFKLTDINKA